MFSSEKLTEDINQELEEQFNHTMEHRITKWSHTGLGFESEDANSKSAGASGDSKPSADKDNSADDNKTSNNDKDTSSKDDSSKKRENEEPPKKSESPPKKQKLMSFVKASD